MSQVRFTTTYNLFRELLKELRVGRELTQAELAQRLGLPQSFVSKYETGERRLDFVETMHVCESMGLTVGEFAALLSARLGRVRHAKGRKMEGGTP